MKISRSLIGKMVKIIWHDPSLTESDEDDRRLGRRSLAKQVEYGIVSDITDGVVEITHTETYKWPDSERPDKRTRTTVQEEIISSVEVATFEKPQADGTSHQGASS